MSLRSAIIATIAAVAAISLVAKVEAAPMDNTRTLTRVNDIENNGFGFNYF
ncbi:hypothetical protein BJ684DRAFT_21913 [Piptocephalis cylindrospora]|uniref:Uncharacterized protein n=1 Tax=Piptocephalis cylindrospora TaxID=1907219 RepID=A0A4P9Y139_9FUNG|nr:hypothetical protein BJ684DRAFT_21913 [Piptocephalis cylindrospora]|eukprot:RKP11510.1 hypothetical protein BJ684DRAFT_21913 [Piptocephalis cylindrospora]